MNFSFFIVIVVIFYSDIIFTMNRYCLHSDQTKCLCIERLYNRYFNLLIAALILDEISLLDLDQTSLIVGSFYSSEIDSKRDFLMLLLYRNVQKNRLVENENISLLGDMVDIADIQIDLFGNRSTLACYEHSTRELDLERNRQKCEVVDNKVCLFCLHVIIYIHSLSLLYRIESINQSII